jgi:hypothetical protein
MAKQETMTINGFHQECLNINQPVGRHQPNLRSDVKLIQAMFWKLAEWVNAFGGGPGHAFLGLGSPDEVPDPRTGDGNFEDGKTEKAIWSYQRKHARNLLRVDGIVHPAAYPNRNIKGAASDIRLMTITLLHFHLNNFVDLATDKGYIEEIKRFVQI